MFLGYVELFHEKLHGFDEFSEPNIHTYFITIFSIKSPIKYLKLLENISDMDLENYYSYICENNSTELNHHRNILFHLRNQTKKLPFINQHPTIRNFLNIQEFFSPQLHIFEKLNLSTGESICILKTFWLKCIQRKWKKICSHNKRIIKIMTSIKNIKQRETKMYTNRLIGIKGLWYHTPNPL